MAQTRITAGEYRGRILATPPGRGTRPTTSRVREALFNILADDVRAADVVDLFAGAGTIGLEALSRGARVVTFVERDGHAIQAIEQSARTLGCGDRCRVVRDDVVRWVGRHADDLTATDLCYIDAPYQDAALDSVLSMIGRRPPELVVCEHQRSRHLASEIGKMSRTREAMYGLAHLSFYRPTHGLASGEQPSD